MISTLTSGGFFSVLSNYCSSLIVFTFVYFPLILIMFDRWHNSFEDFFFLSWSASTLSYIVLLLWWLMVRTLLNHADKANITICIAPFTLWFGWARYHCLKFSSSTIWSWISVRIWFATSSFDTSSLEIDPLLEQFFF